jgi:hypothetical protein
MAAGKGGDGNLLLLGLVGAALGALVLGSRQASPSPGGAPPGGVPPVGAPNAGCEQCTSSIGGYQSWLGPAGSIAMSSDGRQNFGPRIVPVCVRGQTVGYVPASLFGGPPPNCAAGT